MLTVIVYLVSANEYQWKLDGLISNGRFGRVAAITKSGGWKWRDLDRGQTK